MYVSTYVSFIAFISVCITRGCNFYAFKNEEYIQKRKRNQKQSPLWTRRVPMGLTLRPSPGLEVYG